MAPDRNSRTYRVQNLPAFLKKSKVAEFLARSVEDLGPQDGINVFSLAAALDWWNTQSKTATLTFDHVPVRFDNDKDEWSIQVDGFSRSLIFDIHFRGLTPYNDVDPVEHQLDCIAISGLASHPFGSWKQRDDTTTFMWLRDRLPQDLPQLRVVTYGYDTSLFGSKSVQDIDDLARSMVKKLESIRQLGRHRKPMIFIAHSLGGIVLKRALMLMANSAAVNQHLSELFRLVYMIILFGVPARGMHVSHLLPMVQGQPNESLIQALSRDSEYLSRLHTSFEGITSRSKIRLIAAYETRKSPTPKKSVEGKWERGGQDEYLVEQSSAVAGCEDNDTFPVDEDHSNMVKFSEGSEHYTTVVFMLHCLCESIGASSANMPSVSEPPLLITGNECSSVNVAAPPAALEHNPQEQEHPKRDMIASLRFDEINDRYENSSSLSSSSRGSQSHMSRRVHEQNLAPKTESHVNSPSAKAKMPKIVEVTSNDGTVRHMAEIPQATRQQPQRKTTFCSLCNDHPQGFHGDHELRRHIERHHTTYRKVWVCKDNSESDGLRPDVPLSNCKACRNHKTYGANYNAAAHLRRAHFYPCKNKRGGRGKISENRGGMGGEEPPVEVLKNWMYEQLEVNAIGNLSPGTAPPQWSPIDADMITDYSQFDETRTHDNLAFNLSPEPTQYGADLVGESHQFMNSTNALVDQNLNPASQHHSPIFNTPYLQKR